MGYCTDIQDFDGRRMGFILGNDGMNKEAYVCYRSGRQELVAIYDSACDVTRWHDGSGRQRRGEGGLSAAIMEAFDREG